MFTDTVKVISAVVVAVAIAAGIYLFGFALAKDSADRSTDVTRSTEQYRTATEASIRSKVSEISRIDVDMAKEAENEQLVAALTGQRAAYLRDACADVAKIRDAGLPSDIATFASANC